MADKKNKEAVSINDAVSKKVSEYFAKKNSKSEVYSTSDGFLFENPGFAKNHAATLEDKNVTPHKDASKVEVVDEEDLTEDDKTPSGAAATQTNA